DARDALRRARAARSARGPAPRAALDLRRAARAAALAALPSRRARPPGPARLLSSRRRARPLPVRLYPTRPPPQPRAVSRFLLSIALTLPVPLAALQSDADEQYRFLAGLVEKGMNEMAVEQAQTFLRSFPDHPKAPLARYRLAGALWEL